METKSQFLDWQSAFFTRRAEVGKVKNGRVFLLLVVKPIGSHSSKLIQFVC